MTSQSTVHGLSTSGSFGSCRHHPTATAIGECVDCHEGFCEECAVEILRHGTVCLDCGSRFAQKKLSQAYIAAGLGLVAGIAIAYMAASEKQWAFAVAAPFIYPYMFAAVFFGWHYGGKIWTRLVKFIDHMTGMTGFVASILLLSLRLTAALILGIFGGGIVQYRRYRDILKFQQSLPALPATPPPPKARSAAA